MRIARQIEVCILNIVATPHPRGIYERLLSRAASQRVRAHGSDHAKITLLRKDKDNHNLFTGRVLIWSEIDKDKPWLDIMKEDVISEEAFNKIVIPENAKPNFRVFNYVFNDNNHHLYFESRNELGENLGPTTSKRIFQHLLEDVDENTEVIVSIVSDTKTVDRILSLPKLAQLIIQINKPNPDTSSTEARDRIFGELESAGLRQVEQKFTKAKGETRIKPTESMRELANVAAEGDGVVIGKEYGKPEISSDKLPRRVQVEMDRGSSFLSRLRSALRWDQ